MQLLARCGKYKNFQRLKFYALLGRMLYNLYLLKIETFYIILCRILYNYEFLRNKFFYSEEYGKIL